MKAVKGGLKFKGFHYDFSIDGGAIGVIQSDVFIPANALIIGTIFQVTDAVTSATSTATIEIDVELGATIQPATIITDLPDSLAIQSVNDIIGAADLITGAVVAGRLGVFNGFGGPLGLDIEVEPLTGGVFTFGVWYIEIIDNTIFPG